MATTLSGIITVATAGTAQQGTDVPGHLFAIKAHPDNTDTAWVGNVSGDVAATNGFPLNPGEALIIELSNLNVLYFDTDVSGEKVCWVKLD
jgi:hypothetical protein